MSVDREALLRDRDQLWAEAVDRYKQGEKWWPTTEDEANIIRLEQAKRKPSDPLVDELHEIVWFKSEWRVKDILADLNFAKKDRTSYHDAVIGRRMPEFEFTKKRKHRGGDLWIRPYPIPEHFHLRITQSIVEQLDRISPEADIEHIKLRSCLLSDPEIKSIFDKNIHNVRNDPTWMSDDGDTLIEAFVSKSKPSDEDEEGF